MMRDPLEETLLSSGKPQSAGIFNSNLRRFAVLHKPELGRRSEWFDIRFGKISKSFVIPEKAGIQEAPRPRRHENFPREP
jgi:hypothetical protein